MEKKSEKCLAAATAINEGEIILNMIDLENENIKLSQIDMNDAYYTVPIKEDIVYMQNIFNESDKESDDKELYSAGESANYPAENPRRPRNLSWKTRKGRLPKKLVPKVKKLELNSTNLKQKSKKHA